MEETNSAMKRAAVLVKGLESRNIIGAQLRAPRHIPSYRGVTDKETIFTLGQEKYSGQTSSC